MTSRVETAAATRRALVDAAAALLAQGGPEAVTLREVGARAGVSRGAPYRHFADKDSLLMAIGAESWERVAAALSEIRAGAEGRMPAALRAALLTLVQISRSNPHLYRLMFSAPTGNPEAAVRAAERAQDEFLKIVASVVGVAEARRYGALLLASTHGLAAMELSGHLSEEKWHTSAEELIETSVTLAVSASREP